MNITIKLTPAQVKGITAYLKEVSGNIDPKITKADIEQEIRGAIDSHLQSGSIGDYCIQYLEHHH